MTRQAVVTGESLDAARDRPALTSKSAARMFARQLMRAARQTAGQVSSKETARHVSRSPLVVARAARRTAVTRCCCRGGRAVRDGGSPAAKERSKGRWRSPRPSRERANESASVVYRTVSATRSDGCGAMRGRASASCLSVFHPLVS